MTRSFSIVRYHPYIGRLTYLPERKIEVRVPKHWRHGRLFMNEITKDHISLIKRTLRLILTLEDSKV